MTRKAPSFDLLKLSSTSLANEIDSEYLAGYLNSLNKEELLKKCLIVDCRSFIQYNNCHIQNAINAFYSKIIRRRLVDNKVLF